MTSITINTMAGTFIVPAERTASLIAWLQANAVKVGAQQNVMEVYTQSNQQNKYTGTQLINE